MAYLSKGLSPKHLGMFVYEKEMMTVVYVVQKLCPYLIGRHFKVYTDDFSLKYMLEQCIFIPMQQKWSSNLIGSDFKIYFRSGKEDKVVDLLFRMNESSKRVIVMAISFLLVD